MENVTINDLAADIAQVIDTLGGGKAIIVGHAFGQFIAKILAIDYSENVPTIVGAADQTGNVPENILRRLSSQPTCQHQSPLVLQL
jgi:pimeloyl-ACP methyl ester carboxylesterase